MTSKSYPHASALTARDPHANASTEPGRSEGTVPRLLRFPAVRERTGLSRSTIWRLERAGAFPRHRQISANAVAWMEHEVSAWIHARDAS